ncbi:Crp/Fnr family transcriptional regulator [uncultured Agrobacterium sp.]|uniref:Crp/Fnr family transcriptional regulator n=1 Tax=uncultured Agrobacterium sp. TaxID=157277 RepID=UPI0025D29FB8|nr:Crp/Fnr family transcriptional regulator [uncultured Agrobacterium sp.]
MDDPEKLGQQNQLVAFLPDDVRAELLKRSTIADLMAGDTFIKAGQRIDKVFFICSGIASVLVSSRSGKVTESGIVGREGFVPSGALVDAETSFTDVIMQVSGQALVLDIGAVQAMRNRHRILEQLMTCASHALKTQIECTLLSNTTQTVSQRLARWVLVCHDRVDGNQLHLTHEFLSLMLAVRRPSVTDALHFLEGRGFIRSERAKIIIRNRHALEDYAGDIYGLAEQERDRIFARFRASAVLRPSADETRSTG